MHNKHTTEGKEQKQKETQTLEEGQLQHFSMKDYLVLDFGLLLHPFLL
jgi:hypothetical protein